MEFASERRARIAFAVLSSRIVYWLWHVHGDGFHVARGFVNSIPFGQSTFNEKQSAELAGLGHALWQELRRNGTASVNGGKVTVAYRPLCYEDERDRIDATLAEAAGLSRRFAEGLREYVRRIVIIDEADSQRGTVVSHFRRPKGLS
jgi:hypothetical protein